METKLYPLKFTPILKDKIWGGSKLKNILKKPTDSDKCGESWELSGVDGNISVVSNGFLEGNTLEEAIEVYMGDLVGETIFETFGTRFPLLIKFIDANQDLSIQVHPDDKIAKERHKSFGKTEMWYVMQAEKDAELIVGFNQPVNKDSYLRTLNSGRILEILNKEKVSAGDVFFMPSGRVHSIGAGILLAEIQQTSDVTYRIYDFDRKDDQGKTRELHTDLALDAIEYTHEKKYKSTYQSDKNTVNEAARCPYFTTNVIPLEGEIKREYHMLDSFVIYMCTEGEFTIHYSQGTEEVKQGETVLLPSIFENVQLKTSKKANILEVYI